MEMRKKDALPNFQRIFKQLFQWSLGTIAVGRGWMEKKGCSVTENAVIDIGIFHDGSCVMPFTVYDESDSCKRREDEDTAK